MKNVLVTMLAVVVLCGAANGAIFSDDFESYDIETSADFSVGGVATGTWTASPLAGSRTFSTSNFGGSKLWISNTDGTAMTSQGIAVASNTDYVFTVNLVAESYGATKGVDATVDILLGATSLIGGPQTFIAHGDDWGTPDSYDGHLTTINFSTDTVGAEELTLVITRVGTSAGYDAAWFGVDNVDVSVVPEPATMVLLGLGGLLLRRRRA
jgi:hypothetical protein